MPLLGSFITHPFFNSIDWQEEELRDSILLVFANKQDQKGALNASQVSSRASRDGAYE